jgi:hypothetical protein
LLQRTTTDGRSAVVRVPCREKGNKVARLVILDVVGEKGLYLATFVAGPNLLRCP